MKKTTIAIFLFGMTLATETYAQTEPYRNPNLSPKERAADLLKRLTLKEKISYGGKNKMFMNGMFRTQSENIVGV